MSIKNNKIVKNASWIVFCRCIQSILSLIIGMISARYLGPSNYGLISYAASITTFIVPIVQLGLRNTLVQEIIETPDEEGEVLGTTLLLTVLSSALGIVGIISFVSIVNRNDTDTIIVCILFSFSLFFQMLEMIQYWFQSKYLSKYTSVVSLVAYFLVSAYKIYLLITQKSVFWFALTSTFEFAIISITLIIIYRRLGGQKFSFSWGTATKLFSKSKYYIVSGMMVTLFSQTDKIMLTIMIDTEVTGIYSSAVTCAGVASFVYVAIIDSFRPNIFEEKKINNDNYERRIKQLYFVIIILTLMQNIVFCLFSKYVILFLYGYEYISATKVLMILTWYTTFSYIGSIRNIWILAENKQKILWKINLIGAVMNVICNLFLIPMWGAVGAAVASLFTQLFTNFILCFFMRELKPNLHLILNSLNWNNINDIKNIVFKKAKNN